MTDTPIEKLNFEDALQELESVVSRLERGDVALDATIELYARGALLKAACERMLAEAEERIARIALGPDGHPVGTQPFDAS
jgi:exodeoxyribonuclease VII small subunit